MPNNTKQATDLNLPSSGFFITGTDTDVGKTYAAGCIAYSLVQQDLEVIPRKPIASGCIKDKNGNLQVVDAEFLKQASQTQDTIKQICPFQFEPVLSPQTAIRQAGLQITVNELITECHFKPKAFYLVEGAGGFYSPICSNGLNKDLANQLGLPIILVVKNQLGCLNQALLSIEAIQNSGLKLHAIILNYADQEDYASDLSLWTDIPIWKLNYSPQQTLQLIDELT